MGSSDLGKGFKPNCAQDEKAITRQIYSGKEKLESAQLGSSKV